MYPKIQVLYLDSFLARSISQLSGDNMLEGPAPTDGCGQMLALLPAIRRLCIEKNSLHELVVVGS